MVSWNDAAEMNDRVCRLALVMPSSSGRRAVLDHYSVGLLDELIARGHAVDGGRVRDLRRRPERATHWMLLTLPFVMYGVFRVLYLIHHHGPS